MKRQIFSRVRNLKALSILKGQIMYDFLIPPMMPGYPESTPERFPKQFILELSQNLQPTLETLI